MRPTQRLLSGPHRHWKVDPAFRTAKTHYEPSLKDPAWEKWVQMKSEYRKGFVFTWKNIFPTSIGMLGVPVAIYYADRWEESKGRYHWNLGNGIYPAYRSERKIEDLETNHFLKHYGIYDEPEIKISTWKD